MALRYTCPQCKLSLNVAEELVDDVCPKCAVAMTKEQIEGEEVHVAKTVVNATLTSSSRIAAERAEIIAEVEKEKEVSTTSDLAAELKKKEEELEAKIKEIEALTVQKRERSESAKAWYAYAQELEEKVKNLQAGNGEKTEADVASEAVKVQELEEKIKSLENALTEAETKAATPVVVNGEEAKSMAVENVMNSAEMEAKKLEAAKQMKNELWTKMSCGSSIGMGLLVYLYLLLVRPNMKADSGAMLVVAIVLIVNIIACYMFVKDFQSSVQKGKEAKENMRQRKEQAMKVQAETRKANKKTATAAKTVATSTGGEATAPAAEKKSTIAPRKINVSSKHQEFAARAAAMKKR